jgi:hypothetical protein
MWLWSEARLKNYYDLLHNIVLITDVKDSNRLNGCGVNFTREVVSFLFVRLLFWGVSRVCNVC